VHPQIGIDVVAGEDQLFPPSMKITEPRVWPGTAPTDTLRPPSRNTCPSSMGRTGARFDSAAAALGSPKLRIIARLKTGRHIRE
jgi:hypothetical protein